MYNIVYNIIMTIIYVVVFILSISILICGISQLISVIFGAPYFRTSDEVAKKAIKMVDIKSGENFYDLGCGSGRILKQVADNYNANVYGIEISPLQFLKAKILTIDNKNIHIYHKNVKIVNLKDADVIFCYLQTSIMRQLEKKFKRELKKGARVISHSFPLPNIKPVKTKKIGKHTLYLYKF